YGTGPGLWPWRLLHPHYIDIRRDIQRKRVSRKGRIRGDLVEGYACGLPEGVQKLEPAWLAIPETDVNVRKAGIATPRPSPQPGQAITLTAALKVKSLFKTSRAEKDGCGRCPDGLIHRAFGNLSQIRIVLPEHLAIGHHHLLIGFQRVPAELTRALECELALLR